MLNFSFNRCMKTPSTIINHVTKPGMSIYFDTQNLSGGEDYRAQFKKTMADFYTRHPNGNPDGAEYIHVMLSNEKYDGQTAAEMHMFALRFAKTIFPNAQFIVATQPHDTPALPVYRHEAEPDDSLHSHIIVCAASPITGDIVHVAYSDYPDLRRTAEAMGKDYGFEPKEKKAEKLIDLRRDYEELSREQDGELSWTADLRRKISAAVTKASTLDEFHDFLKKDGIRTELTPSLDDFVYFHPSRDLPCRGKTLGKLFTKHSITAVIDGKRI
ncbi:MAG: relaxase/mobilization nuclease domain-containing protein [Clostridia bacterium]|nr:relaxase/mobilization nuclease domain-containing protein [Clostridia bacterium]